MRYLMSMVAILLLMASGGNETAGESSQAGVSDGATPSPASASETSADPAFQATISGALDRTLEGDHVRSGAKYRRYHINMASREPAGTCQQERCDKHGDRADSVRAAAPNDEQVVEHRDPDTDVEGDSEGDEIGRLCEYAGPHEGHGHGDDPHTSREKPQPWVDEDGWS